MTLEELRKKRLAAKQKMDSIVAKAKEEDRAVLSEEEQTSYDAARQEFIDLGAAIEREEERARFDAELDEPARQAVGSRISSVPVAPRAKTEFESFGEFLSAVHQARRGGGLATDPRLQYEAGLSSKTGEDGGFMIPDEFSTDLQYVEPEQGPLFSRAFKIPAGSSPDAAITFPVLRQSSSLYGGIEFNEVDAEPASNLPEVGSPKLDLIKLAPKTFGGVLSVPNALLQNWQASETLLRTMFKWSRSDYLEKRILTGTGVGQMLGILAADNAARKDVARAAANDIRYSDITDMEVEHTGPDAFWMVQKKALKLIRRMKDDAGQLIYQEGGNANSGGLPTLLGKPVVLSDRSPAIGSRGDIMLLSMGFAYWVKQGSGPFIDVSEHVDFKKNGTVFRILESMDGQPSLKAPLVGEGGTNTYSPFVALNAYGA